jgi:hypothetical protein
MSLELSLSTATRLAQFAARFEAQADGSWVYFHPDGRAGLPCTQVEAGQLIAEFAESQRQSVHRLVYWVIASGVVIGVLEASGTLVLPRWAQYAIFLMPFLFVLQDRHDAYLRPLRYLEGRMPAAPSHTASRARRIRIAALPASLIAAMLLPAVGLTYYAAQTGWTMDNALIVSSNLLLAMAWVIARRQKRRVE